MYFVFKNKKEKEYKEIITQKYYLSTETTHDC